MALPDFQQKDGSQMGGIQNSVDPAAAADLDAWWVAVESGYVKTLAELAAKRPELIEAKGPTGCTALWLAMIREDTAMAQWLLENGANANRKGFGGASSFLGACSSGSWEMTQVFLPFADLAEKDDTGSTGLMQLVAYSEKNKSSATRAQWSALAARFDVEARNASGHSALSLAITFGDQFAVEGLLDHASASAEDCERAWTAAQVKGKTQKLDALLAHPKGESLRARLRVAIGTGEMQGSDFPKMAAVWAQEEAESLRGVIREAQPASDENRHETPALAIRRV